MWTETGYQLWQVTLNAAVILELNLQSSRLLCKNVKIRMYKTIILHVVLCGCETWSLTLRRRIFGPKWNELMGGWTEIHKDELHKLYCSPSIFRMFKSNTIILVRHVSLMVEKRNV
jgi:hypothetical protein